MTSCSTLVISPYSLRRRRCPLRSFRRIGCSAAVISGAMTSAYSARCADIRSRNTIVTSTCARFWTLRVATSARIAFACSVSVRMRAITWPVLVRENHWSGRRCMCRKTVSRKSRVMRSWSEAPSWPPNQMNRFFTSTSTMIMMITPRSDAIGSPATIIVPTRRLSMSVSHPLPTGIACCEPKSVLRNGISSENATASSPAATTFDAIFPASRLQCGRRNASSRR